MGKRLLGVFIGLMILMGGAYAIAQDEEPALSDDPAALKQAIEEQKIQLDELIERLNALEAKQDKSQDAVDKSGWAQKITLKGDFRYRHEVIEDQGKANRTRQRLRTRIGMEAEVNPAVRFSFGLATGENYDPVSTNQTETGSFGKKDVFIDYMYATWVPPGATDATLTMGRMKKPWFIPGGQQLIWDSDLNVEGMAFNWSPTFGSNQIMTHAGGYWITERGADKDTMLYSAQLGLKHTMPGGLSNLVIGGSYFEYSQIKGRELLYDPTKSAGNSTITLSDGTTKVYANDYKLLEYFAEYNTVLGTKQTALQIYGDYVTNQEVDTDNTGWMAGITYGKLKNPRDWALRYAYRKLEKDAVVGAFSDSDFIGGGTNGEGSVYGFDYQISKNCSTAVTYFANTKGMTNGTDYNRLQIDLNYKY